MNKRTIFKLLLCIIVSFILSCLFQYTKSKVIDYYVIINILISLFSVSLAIAALMITILEKYKEKATKKQSWAEYSSDILKEICENTIALLFLIILLALASILEPIIALVPKFDVMTTILLFSFIVSFLAMFDTTISIYKLVVHLKDILAPDNDTFIPSRKEIYLIEAYRLLDNKYKEQLDMQLKTLSLQQEIEKNESYRPETMSTNSTN